MAGVAALIVLLAVLQFTTGIVPAFATSACPPYATAVASYTPGPGFAGADPKNDPTKALGIEDGLFVSLGQGGSIILQTGAPVTSGVVTVEAACLLDGTCYGGNSAEGAFVEVSETLAGPYIPIGTAVGTSSFTLPPGVPVNFIKITDDGSPVSPSQSPGYDLDSVGTPCGEPTVALVVTKTAQATLTRTYTWTIDKGVTPNTWQMFAGDEGTSKYTVSVDQDTTDSDWAVSGVIAISNPNASASAIITSVLDVVDGIPASVSCPFSFPYTLAGGGSVECTYTASLPDGSTRTNTATVTTSGEVAGDTASATVDFATATVTTAGYPSVTVDDTNGQSWSFAGDGSVSYTKTFACDADEGLHDNTATIQETGASDSTSVSVDCYSLIVTKDANPTKTRNYKWKIDKWADETAITLKIGATKTVSYKVTVDKVSKTEGWAVSGAINVQNPTPLVATINGVSDTISGVGPAVVTCPVTFPYTLPAGGTLTCTYTATLPDGSARTNTATAALQNYSYASDGAGTPSGTTGFTGSAAINFTNAPLTEVDKCITVTDTLKGVLGTVCYGSVSLPKKFSYDWKIGPYAACGDYTVENTATFETADTHTTGSDSWTVKVNVPCPAGCTLTYGYWKTHSKYGPSKYDATWAKVMPSGEDSPFFLSGKTYYEVMKTSPSGGSAYYILAHQYIAAYLNGLAGANTSAVTAEMAHAKTLFETYTPSDQLSDAVRKDFIATALVLAKYNMGIIGPGHCDSGCGGKDSGWGWDSDCGWDKDWNNDWDCGDKDNDPGWNNNCGDKGSNQGWGKDNNGWGDKDNSQGWGKHNSGWGDH